MDVFLERMLITVVIKLIDPKIDEMPAKWRLKIAMSTPGELWNRLSDRGG
jgi:hypothetical protein